MKTEPEGSDSHQGTGSTSRIQSKIRPFTPRQESTEEMTRWQGFLVDAQLERQEIFLAEQVKSAVNTYLDHDDPDEIVSCLLGEGMEPLVLLISQELSDEDIYALYDSLYELAEEDVSGSEDEDGENLFGEQQSYVRTLDQALEYFRKVIPFVG